MTQEYCYSYYEDGPFVLDVKEAVADGIACLYEIEFEEIKRDGKISIFRGVVRKPKPSAYFGKWGVETLLENMNCAAGDDAGEAAEDFAMYVPQEAQARLRKLIEDWCDEELECSFYCVDSVEEIVVELDTLTPEE